MFEKYHLGIKALIKNSQGQILLLKLNPANMKTDSDNPYWDIPGGRVKPHDIFLDTLKSKVKEETGIEDLKINQSFGFTVSNMRLKDGDTEVGLILLVYLCSTSTQDITLNAAHTDYKWCSATEASELLKDKYASDFTVKLEATPKMVGYSGNIIQVLLESVTEVRGDKEVIKVYEQARRSPGVRLIITSKDKILLTKEYRHELKSFDYRLPGGKVFDALNDYVEFLKTGQDVTNVALAAAKKEASEEVGLNVESAELFYKSSIGATVEWDLYYILVKGFNEKSDGQALESGENITSQWFSYKEAKDLALSGQMSEDRSVAVLLRYLYSINSL